MASVAAILGAGALAGCGAAHRRTPARHGEPAVLATAILPGAWLRSTATARPQASKPHTTWLINPDQPLPANSPWRSVLAVARRFAAADLSYEVGEVGPAVRAAITHTCTAPLAAQLLSHRAILPPGTTARQVRQRLVAVMPLERLAASARVLATGRSVGRRGAPGALELRLVPRPGGWRVASIRVL